MFFDHPIENNHIDVVAYSFMTTEAGSFCELSKQLRQLYPQLIIIAGGPHPTYYPQLIDTWPIDAIVKGEGDHVINELIER